jgi:hypothetical protein
MRDRAELARRRAAALAEDEKQEAGGKSPYADERLRYYVNDEDELKELGVGYWFAAAGDKGKEASYSISFLDPHPDDGEPFQLGLFVHTNIGPNNDAFLCPLYMAKQFERYKIEPPPGVDLSRCPICEEEDRLVELQREMPEGDDRDNFWKKHIKPLRPYYGRYSSPRPNKHLVWVLDSTSEETEDKGPCYWLMPTTVYWDGVIEYSKSPDGSRIDITDPSEHGFIFHFKRTGEGQYDTKYSGFRFMPRQYSLPEELLRVPRYQDILIFKTYEEIRAALPIFNNDEEPTPPPPPSSGRRRATTETAEAPAAQPTRRRTAAETPEAVSSEGQVDPPEGTPDPGTNPTDARARLRQRLGQRQAEPSPDGESSPNTPTPKEAPAQTAPDATSETPDATSAGTRRRRIIS